jgi:hypothetical protein
VTVISDESIAVQIDTTLGRVPSANPDEIMKYAEIDRVSKVVRPYLEVMDQNAP